MTLSLLRSRYFGPLFGTQFLGALNDNLFKSALVVTVTFRAATEGLSTDVLVNAATALLILPFFLFSALAGQLADRFDKARLIRILKVTETAVMLLGALGFFTGSVPMLFAALFLMGTQSAFFGPVKYGILPQHLREEQLMAANGLVEAGTFAGILLGTILGGLAITLPHGGALVGLATVGVAGLGWVIARRVPSAPSANPTLRIDRNPLRAIGRTLRVGGAKPSTRSTIAAISWFWFMGSVVVAQLPLLAKDVLGADELLVTGLLTVFSLGVGLGSIAVEKLSKGRVDLTLVPIAGTAMAGILFDLGFAAAQANGPSIRIWIDLLLVGVSGGAFAVPLYAFLQKDAPKAVRSQVIAANNLVNALFMVAAAGFAIGCRSLGLSIPQLLMATAVLHAAVVAWMAFRLRIGLLRALVQRIVRVAYRVRVHGLEAVPRNGAALLVANHPSFADAVILGAVSPRPVRFVMHYQLYSHPLCRWFFRSVGAIPIASHREDPAILKTAMNRIDEALAAGELVVIFPEGKLTRDGEIDTFRPGVERILARRPVPVVPLALRGMWGSFFSYGGGKPMQKRPKRFRSPVEVIATSPLPPTVTASQLQSIVGELRGTMR